MYPKPVVVVSACLGFEACRYNGQMIEDSFVRSLKEHVTFIAVCPEKAIGLGVPRKPVRMAMIEKKPHLYQPATQEVFTEKMIGFAKDFFETCGPVDGFLLKNRSPSCGPGDVKVYDGTSKSAGSRRGRGLFAECAALEHPSAVMEDEGRLKSFELREQFLVRLYTLARFRQTSSQGSMRDLVSFQSTHKLLLLAWNQTRFRKCGRITANHEKKPLAEVYADYGAELQKIMTARPRTPSMINTLMHAFGWISEGLSPEERVFFLESLEEYRDERIPLSALLRLLKGYAVRFQKPYLLEQVLLSPFPSGLVTVSDSGKGRGG
ncbi:MAG: DUF523 and DUF1722 domain-containing protein [Desulfobacterales bacterium]|nr:DUF523 and DUF1722 domain-containing protein [Desulfobacterales bacterium]